MPQTPPPGAPGGPGLPGADQWYTPPTGPGPQRKRPRWLIPAGAAAAIVVIVVALVLALSPGSPKTNSAGSGTSPTAGQTNNSSPAAGATPTVGELQVSQFQVGDCLTGANMQLNLATPWPKLTLAVPCSQAHTAEVFYSNKYFFAQNGSFPGDNAIRNKAITGCNNAFKSYVGISFEQSLYTWADIVPDASTWPTGDRALHCVAWHKTSSQPAGATLHGSIKGTAK
jgi:hypothetical protein